MKISQTRSKNQADVPRAGKFVELAGAGENDDSDIGVTQNGEFLGLLEQPSTTFGERDLTAVEVVDPLNLNFTSAHCFSASLRYFPFLSSKWEH